MRVNQGHVKRSSGVCGIYGQFDKMLDEATKATPPEPEALQPIGFSDLMIQTKDKHVVAFVPNSVQQSYLDTLCPAWRQANVELRGLREVLLKARQFGFSTLILALFFRDTINNPNTNTVVIANDATGTEKLFKIVKLFYERLPEDKKPPTRYATRREFEWPTINSSFRVLTAGTKTSGRGATIHNLHMSETAYWEYPEVITGLLQSVPSNGNIFSETTANGEVNQFHGDYTLAKEGRSTFTPRFFAWWRHDEYRTAPSADFIRITQGSPITLLEQFGDEGALAALYDLDDAQLNWRRNKMREPGLGSLFAQEYPADDTEAFRVSGKRFFTEWDAAKHTCLPFDIPRHWTYIGGLDWGYAAPFCFLLAAIDVGGNVVMVDEIYHARLINRDQADSIVHLLAKWGLNPHEVQIACDPAMWARKVQSDGIGRADIEDFYAARLRCVPANNNRQHGWSNLRNYLHDEGALRVFKGNCPNLIRTMPLQLHDAHNPEDMDSDLEDHPVDTARYLLHTRIRGSKPVAREPILLQNGRAMKRLTPESTPFALLSGEREDEE